MTNVERKTGKIGFFVIRHSPFGIADCPLQRLGERAIIGP